MSPTIRQYEEAFGKWINGRKCFSFWKGRVALHAILQALGVQEGDEVILPGYTCVMDVNPIMYLGAKPVYVDIEPNTYNLDVNLLEQKITPRTKVIIAQHTYGYPVEMDAVLQIAGRKGIAVIEDCCLALGGKYKGKTLGTLGKAAYFSFQWNKPYTTGLGGMALCNDAGLAEKIEKLCQDRLIPVPVKKSLVLQAQLMVYRGFIYPRTTALAQNVFRWLNKKGFVVGSSTNQELAGNVAPDDFFMGMSDVQARAGLRQIARLERNIDHRRKMAKMYDELLSQRGWTVSQLSNDMDPVLVRYPVRITEKWKAVEQAASRGVELGTWFESPLHPKETSVELYGYRWGMCPQAEKAAEQVVNLPLHPRTSEKTIRRTVDFICGFKQA
ncbi:MAG: DegT/DnrJ/EryC1/StrS family aminotransferase [Phycisphaerae bacterium]